MAFKWRFGKKKGNDAVETSVETTSETLNNAQESTAPEIKEEPSTVREPIADLSAEPVTDEVPTQQPEELADDAVDPLFASEEPVTPSEEAQEEPVSEQEPLSDPIVEEAPVTEDLSNESEDATPESVAEERPAPEEPDLPAEEAEETPVDTAEPSAEDTQEPAEPAVEDALEPAEEPAEATEEAVAEGAGEAPAEETEPVDETVAEEIALGADFDDLLFDDGVVPVMPSLPTEEKKESQAEAVPAEEKSEQESSFEMDDDYMRAFMEEGAMDDFVYEGYDAKQELLNKIADNAETLAEEGTALLEQKAKEEEEKKKKEPVYNEKGELLNDDGKVVLKRSLENKLILADTRERRYYNKLKNEILAYEGIKAEMQTATEVFRHGKETVARLSVAGFTRIYFALNPDEFDVDRYKQADKTEVDFDDAKMLIRVRNDDEYAIAVELLAIMMGALNINRSESPVTEDYLPAFPRREDAVLDKKGKFLAFEEKDELALIKEKRAEERKAVGLSEEPEEEVAQEEEAKEEPLVILPLTLDNKIHQSTNTIKLIYSKLKNELLSYKTVRAEMVVKNENFRSKKKIIARMTVVGGAVRLYLALDPAEYSAKKFKHRDASDQKEYEGTRLMVKISSEKEREIAVKLITELMGKNELERNKHYAYVPFAEKYPYIKNGVFKGDENKPRVKHEGEEYTDIYGELTEHLRSQMGSTDAWGVPKGYSAEDGLSARDLLELQRSKAKTINAGVALATPIVYFYDAAINEAGEVQYLNVQQVLNDKFLGKMIPQEYFAMAEGSSRIEELNFFALEQLVKDCNENPDMRFVTKISCRLLLKQETLTKLVDKMKTEHGNLILAFDCAMLEAVGFVGISAINTLKGQGALIMIDNAESASMRVLTEYDFDYLRLDARYYNGDSAKRLAHLDMITGYADVQNIITTSINCEHKEDARILLNHGVKVIQGDAVARPMRLINLALTNIKPVPKVKKDGENRG